MKCLKAEEFADIVSGEAHPERREEVQNHILTCAPCRDRLAALSRAAAAAAFVSPAPVSENFTGNLMARLRREKAAAEVTRKDVLAWLKPREIVFAACSLLLFAAVFFRAGRAPETVAVPRTLYMTDGPATPMRLTARNSSQPAADFNYSDSCMTANCGV